MNTRARKYERHRIAPLWRAVDEDGEVVGVLLQARGCGRAAKRLFERLLKCTPDQYSHFRHAF